MDGSVRPQLSEITVEQKLDTQCSNGIRLFIFLEADNEKNVIHNINTMTISLFGNYNERHYIKEERTD